MPWFMIHWTRSSPACLCGTPSEYPTIVVSAAPMLAGKLEGKTVDLISVFEGVARSRSADGSEGTQALRIAPVRDAAPVRNVYANSMNCVTEALVSACPKRHHPGGPCRRRRLAKEAGMKIMQLFEKDIKPRDIATLAAFKNAIAVDMALGCSTNTFSTSRPLPTKRASRWISICLTPSSKKTPNLCKLSPAGAHHIEDLDAAGGIQA